MIYDQNICILFMNWYHPFTNILSKLFSLNYILYEFGRSMVAEPFSYLPSGHVPTNYHVVNPLQRLSRHRQKILENSANLLMI